MIAPFADLAEGAFVLRIPMAVFKRRRLCAWRKPHSTVVHKCVQLFADTTETTEYAAGRIIGLYRLFLEDTNLLAEVGSALRMIHEQKQRKVLNRKKGDQKKRRKSQSRRAHEVAAQV